MLLQAGPQLAALGLTPRLVFLALKHAGQPTSSWGVCILPFEELDGCQERVNVQWECVGLLT